MNKQNSIIGNWIFSDGEITKDANCLLIEKMIKTELVEEKYDEDWTKYYKDQQGNLWRLTYPHSYMHGGGPPKLEKIVK